MKSWTNYFDFKNQQKKGLLILVLLIAIVQIIIAVYPSKPIIQNLSSDERLALEQLEKENYANDFSQTEESFNTFNPNDLSLEEWVELGFSERQAEVILNYKKMLGGFKNASQLQKCFVISERKFQQLQPFMIFSQNYYSDPKSSYSSHYNKNFYSNSNNLHPFNPNQLSVSAWQSLGFSAKQAEVIVNFKERLGGFKNAEQLQKCFVISDEKFAQIKPFLRFDSGRNSIDYQDFNPNIYTEKDWIAVGFTEKQAQTIIKYKNSIGGFKNAEQLQRCFVISDEKFAQIRPYLIFENKKQEIEKELFTNDLNKISAHQLEALGIETKQAQRIVNYRKSKGKITSFESLREASVTDKNIEILKSKLFIQ